MNKFHNVVTEAYGQVFDSKAEAADWNALRLREMAGEITKLQRQVPFELQPAFREGKRIIRPIVHIVDFMFEEGGRRVVWDTKGIRTAVWTMKHKMFRYQFPEIRYVVRQVESNRRRR